MDEEEFEMMMYYFLFLRRKTKINCAKKRRFCVKSIFQKRNRLGEYIWLWLYDYLDSLQSHYSEKHLFLQNSFSHVESYKLGFFSYFFSCFFKYAQKNTPMHETSPIVVVIVVLKWKFFYFKLTITTTIKQRY